VKPDETRPHTEPERVLFFARDLPNVCSLTGLLAATLGLYFAIRGTYPLALTALLWAVVFDWADGLIARRMPERSADQAAFGAQLDSLIDIVSFSVAPALLLLSVGQFSPWFIPGAFVVLATGVLRLSYFNVFGLVDGSSYRGLALDNNVLVLGLLFVLDVATIRTPKLGGQWFYVVVLYALALTGIYAWQLE